MWSLGRSEGSHLEWLWHIKIKDPFCKVSSIIFATLSFTVVMSELGMMAGKSAEINWWYMALNDSRNNAASVIFLSLIPLTYITFLVFWSLFRMRLPGMMIMVNGQQSSPKSMSFVARRAVGIAAPQTNIVSTLPPMVAGSQTVLSPTVIPTRTHDSMDYGLEVVCR